MHLRFSFCILLSGPAGRTVEEMLLIRCWQPHAVDMRCYGPYDMAACRTSLHLKEGVQVSWRTKPAQKCSSIIQTKRSKRKDESRARAAINNPRMPSLTSRGNAQVILHSKTWNTSSKAGGERYPHLAGTLPMHRSRSPPRADSTLPQNRKRPESLDTVLETLQHHPHQTTLRSLPRLDSHNVTQGQTRLWDMAMLQQPLTGDGIAAHACDDCFRTLKSHMRPMRCLFVIITHSLQFNISRVFEELVRASSCRTNERYVSCKGIDDASMCSVSLENKGDEPLGIIDFLMRRYDRLRLYDRIQFVPVTAFYRVKYRKMRALQIARKLAVFPSYYEDAYPVKEGRLAPKFALGRWKGQAL